MDIIVQCCECQRIRQDDAWIIPSFTYPKNVEISHGYCPACATKAIQAVEDYKRVKDSESLLPIERTSI